MYDLSLDWENFISNPNFATGTLVALDLAGVAAPGLTANTAKKTGKIIKNGVGKLFLVDGSGKVFKIAKNAELGKYVDEAGSLVKNTSKASDIATDLGKNVDIGVKAGKEAFNFIDDDLAKMYKETSKGIGSTARIIPNTLEEQLAMKEVLSNPLKNSVDLSKKMVLKDPRWHESKGWAKMQREIKTSKGNKINIHFNWNKLTGEFDDFKFKDKK